MRYIKNQRGVAGIVELLVAVGVIALIGFVIYRAVSTKPVKDSGTAETTTETAKDPTVDWKTYTSETGKFTLKYPADWFAETCDDASSPSVTLYLASTTATRVACFSEKGSQMSIYSASGDSRSQFDLGSIYGSKTDTAVTVDGVSGRKLTGTVTTLEDAPGAMMVGTTVTRYVFYTAGRTYAALYFQTPSGDYAVNNQSDFDLLVSDTLEFN